MASVSKQSVAAQTQPTNKRRVAFWREVVCVSVLGWCVLTAGWLLWATAGASTVKAVAPQLSALTSLVFVGIVGATVDRLLLLLAKD